MAYLKDSKCERCGSNKILINRFHDKKQRKTYIDGATCQICFKNVILPDEEYYEFVREHGTRF